MIKRLLILSLTCFLSSGCHHDKARQSIITISINPADSARTGFSEYFELEKSITLESSGSAMMSDIRKIIFTEDKIFILTWGDAQVMIFDNNGKFLNKVARYGRGPNEYLYAVDMSVSVKGDTIGLYDKYLKKILYYDNNGNYLKTADLNTDLESFTTAENGDLLGYSFLNHVAPFNDTIFQLWHFDPQGKIIDGKLPVNKNILGNSVGLASTFTKSSSGLFFIPITEDLIYKITEDPFKITPAVKLDFKDKTMPPDLLLLPRKEMNEAFDNSYMLSGEFFGQKNLLVNLQRLKDKNGLLAVIRLSDKKYSLINTKYLWDETNEIPLETRMQNTYFKPDRYVAIIDVVRLHNHGFDNKQSLGFKLKQNSKVTDNPTLLIYKEK
jgi:hypothetical protein